MHVYFALIILVVAHVFSAGVALDAADIDELAAYYKKLLVKNPAMSLYVKQASDDPGGFKQTVKQDLTQQFKLTADQLTNDVLMRYVNCETLSMYFMQTGKISLKEDTLLALWNDTSVIKEFRTVPGLIVCFKYPDKYQVGAELLQDHRTALPVFQRAKHSRFQSIAAAYLSTVYRANLFQDNKELRQQYLNQLDQWLLTLAFQQVGDRYLRESIELAVKICAEMDDPALMQQQLKQIAALLIASGEKSWLEQFVQTCIHLQIDAVLDANVQE